MASNNSSNGSGIGIAGLLGIAFIVLKLCHVIKWSWLWVLAPFWISAVVGIIIIVFALTMYVITKGK